MRTINTTKINLLVIWSLRDVVLSIESLNFLHDFLSFNSIQRDDRCVADNGRDGWFPYLDEGVVRLLQSLDMEHVSKCLN
jgi:asparagine synthetase B (glutamine-hydrolysing)